jgi:magnesium-transporting ATPase (P-type)
MSRGQSHSHRSPEPAAVADLTVIELGTAWHAVSANDTLARLETRESGLDTAEVKQRLAQHGLNRLPKSKPRSALSRFITQFHNLLIYVLLAAAVLAALLGHGVDTAVILGVVLVNAVIGFIQEGRAEKALDARVSRRKRVGRGHSEALPASTLPAPMQRAGLPDAAGAARRVE